MADGEKKKYAYLYLVKKYNLTPIQASGIIGNLEAESNFNTTIKGEADDKGSVGIAQWHSERKTGLYNFASKNNKNWSDLDTQLDYLMYELNSPQYKEAKQGLLSAKTPMEATKVFMDKFEKPAEWAKKQSFKNRVRGAYSVLDEKIPDNFEYSNNQEGVQPAINVYADVSGSAPTVGGQVFGAEEAPTETKEEIASKKLLEESFQEEQQMFQQQAQAMQQEQQQYQEAPLQYQVDLQPIEYAPITEFQNGGVIKDDMGYWNSDNWGKSVEISSPNITMKGVFEPLIGESKQTGEIKIMLPGQNYFFENTSEVIEKPLIKQNRNKKRF